MRQHPLCIFVDAIHFWCLTWLERWKSWADIQFTQKKRTTTMKSFENLITFYVVSLNCSAYAKKEFVEKSFVVSFKNQPHYYSIARASWLQLMPKSCVLGSKTLESSWSTSEQEIKTFKCNEMWRIVVFSLEWWTKKLCIHHLRFLFINIFYWNALKSMS